jgi:hypothetical protein
MTDAQPPRRPASRLGAALLLLAVFLAGAVAGGAWQATHPFGRRMSRGPEGFVRHLADELALTAPQQDSVRAILQRHRPQMDSVWAAVRPRFETLRDSIRSDIARQLTDSQRAKFDELNRREAAQHQGHD